MYRLLFALSYIFLFASTAFAALPKNEIETIIEAKGEIKNGVLLIDIGRKDIGKVRGPDNVTFDANFGIDGSLAFQDLGDDHAFLNGDIALKERELQPFIKTLLKMGLDIQAYHHHFPSHPQVWFIHFKGKGNALLLAKAIKAALNVTSTPFPQRPPANPTTPLDVNKLLLILHGHTADVGEEGVVTIWMYRKQHIYIDGILINPQANISNTVVIKPLGNGKAAILADIAMTADEVHPAINLMANKFNWYQGCLYNQEINEQPQLYFDHMIKVGNPYTLAQEIRQGLDLTKSQ